MMKFGEFPAEVWPDLIILEAESLSGVGFVHDQERNQYDQELRKLVLKCYQQAKREDLVRKLRDWFEYVYIQSCLILICHSVPGYVHWILSFDLEIDLIGSKNANKRLR